MDGQIWIESEGLGKGTTVIFTIKLGLPERESEQDRQIQPVAPSSLRTDFSGVKVLVTDDNGYDVLELNDYLVTYCMKSILLASVGQGFCADS